MLGLDILLTESASSCHWPEDIAGETTVVYKTYSEGSGIKSNCVY